MSEEKKHDEDEYTYYWRNYEPANKRVDWDDGYVSIEEVSLEKFREQICKMLHGASSDPAKYTNNELLHEFADSYFMAKWCESIYGYDWE